jgi:hypothetical protein
MLLHPPLEARENLFVTCKACIHASKGPQVPHDQVGMIEYFLYSDCIFWVLHQLVSLGGGGLDTETRPGISWGQR